MSNNLEGLEKNNEVTTAKAMERPIDESAVELVGMSMTKDLDKMTLDIGDGWRSHLGQRIRESGIDQNEFGEMARRYGLEEKMDALSKAAGSKAREARVVIGGIVKSKEFSEVLSLIPFVSGATKIIEAKTGQTLDGRRLGFFRRRWHMIKGAVDLGSDFTEIGEAQKGVRASRMMSKLTRNVEKNPEAILNLGAKTAGQLLEKSDKRDDKESK